MISNPQSFTQKLENSFTFKFSYTHCNFFLVSSVHIQRRDLHSVSVRRIQQLEERANAEDHNPRAQAEYLRVSS